MHRAQLGWGYSNNYSILLNVAPIKVLLSILVDAYSRYYIRDMSAKVEQRQTQACFAAMPPADSTETFLSRLAG